METKEKLRTLFKQCCDNGYSNSQLTQDCKHPKKLKIPMTMQSTLGEWWLENDRPSNDILFEFNEQPPLVLKHYNCDYTITCNTEDVKKVWRWSKLAKAYEISDYNEEKYKIVAKQELECTECNMMCFR